MISYETVHTIRELVESSGIEYKDDVVLRYVKNGQIAEETFGEFAKQCQAFTAWVAYKSKEVGHPIRVAMMGSNSPLYMKLFMGVMCGGGIAIPMDPQMKEQTICGCLKKAEADVYIWDNTIHVDVQNIEKQVSNIREIMPMETVPQLLEQYADCTEQIEVTPADCATIIFTSGTTGEEKGVMLSNGNLIDNIFCTKQAKKNVKLNILPMHHAFCINGDILLCFANCATLCMNGNASKVVENLVLFEPNIVNMVPMVAQNLYNRLLQKAQAEGKSPIEVKGEIFGNRIQKIVAGGAHLPAELVAKYQELGIFLCQGYGMSECSPSISSPDLYRKDKAHTAGKVVFRCKTRVVDGELQVKSPSVMMGYVNAPELTAQVITEDGWLRTGDIGYEDEEGFLHIMGRKKNLIILSNGNNVSPEQIEKQLLDHQIIQQVLVYGEGNNIVAEIYPDPNESKKLSVRELKQKIDDIVAQINENLPFYKQIMKHIVRKTPLQMTASGKIIRAQRASAEDMIVDEKEEMHMPQNDVQQTLWDIISDILGHKAFGIDTDIFEVGMDSLGCVNLLTILDEELDFQMELDQILKLRNILLLEEAYRSKKHTDMTDYSKRPVYELNNVQKYFAYLIRGNTTSNIPVLFQLDKSVDVNRLVDAIKGLFAVHPVLHNVVQMFEDKGYANFRNDDKTVDIPIQVLSKKEWEEKKPTLVRPYLYTRQEPLYHIEIYKVEEATYLFMDIAHIISDGVSLGILIHDMNELYKGNVLEPEQYTFYEYLLDCQEMEKNHVTEKLALECISLFENAEIDRTILNKAENTDLSVSEEAVLHNLFDKLDVNAVKNFCKQHHVSENTLFLTAFAYCVSLFHDQDEVMITSINHGRNDSRYRKIVGCLFKTYNYRYIYKEEETIFDMLHRSGKQLLETFSRHLDNYHSDEMFFQYQGDLLCFDEVAGAPAEMIPLPMDALPFHLSVMQGKRKFFCELRYWKNRYDASMLQMFLSAYEYVLLQMIQGQDIRDAQTYMPQELFPQSDVRNRYGRKQPYGAWGTLYNEDAHAKETVRVMPDDNIDLLQEHGRTVMIEGLQGRDFYELEALEKEIQKLSGIQKVHCCVTMGEGLMWGLTAKLETTRDIKEEEWKTFLEKRGLPFINPVFEK